MLIYFSNAFIFLQDWVLFLGTDDGRLQIVDHIFKVKDPLWTLLLVPQAWSLAVELTFYAVAPFILRSHITVIFGLMLASIATRIVLLKFGFEGDPWTYRFFPSVLALFLAGNLGYRFYAFYGDTIASLRHLRYFPFIAVVALLLFSEILLPGYAPQEKVPLYIGVTLALPFIFSLTRSWAWDRRIGDLSYPVYIFHILGLRLYMTWVTGPFSIVDLICYFAFVVACSALMLVLIERPMEAIRVRFRDHDYVTPTVRAPEGGQLTILVKQSDADTSCASAETVQR